MHDFYAGNFLQVSAGTRTTCAIDGGDSDLTSTTIHCWGSCANALLDHFAMEEKTNGNSYVHNQILMGQDHACASGKNTDGSSDTSQTTLACWRLAGSDFNAHRVPVGLEIVR